MSVPRNQNYEGEIVNVGGSWYKGAGAFYAPTAGAYALTAVIECMTQNSGRAVSYVLFKMIKNGAEIARQSNWMGRQGGSASQMSEEISLYVELAAGDAVDLQVLVPD